MAFPITPSRRVRQPQGAALLRLDGPWLRNVDVVVSGSPYTGNRAGKAATVTGTPALVIGADGIGATYTPLNYLRVPSTASSSPWTIAGLFAAVIENPAPLCGMVELSDVNTFDRSIRTRSSLWSAYLYDGGEKWADAPVAPSATRVDAVVITCNGSTLFCYANGLTNGGTAVSNSGYTGYSSPQFTLGKAGTAAHSGFFCSLAVKTQAYWTPDMARAFCDAPWNTIFVGDPHILYFDLSRPKGTMRPTVRV